MNVLFPIETVSREFDYKLVLAHRVLRNFPNAKVFLGSVSAIHNQLEHFRTGIYFGKTVFPSVKKDINRSWKEKLEKKNFNIVFLHEEGAVFEGGDETMRRELMFQYDIDLFNPKDIVCVWGEKQKELEEQRNTKRIKIVVTGSPRFDLPKNYIDFFQERLIEVKEKYGHYVLVNGNFGASNHGDGYQKMFSYLSRHSWSFEENLEYFIKRNISSNERMLRMSQLIIVLSKRHPDLTFLYRPHPSENISTYHEIFRGCKNVVIERKGSFIEYLLGSKLMIHDGCTTSIEAQGLNIPIVNYKFVRDEFDLFLPDSIGMIADSIDAVDEYVMKIKNNIDIKYENIVNDRAKSLLYNLSNSDSFDICYGMIAKSIKRLGYNESVTPTSFQFYKEIYLRKTKVRIALLKNRLLNNKIKLLRDRYLLDKFGGIDKNSLRSRVGILNKMHRCKVNVKYYSDELVELYR